MIGRRLRCASAALVVAASVPVLAQVGHPAKGAWSGYWGPNEDERHRILLAIDWVTHGWNDNELVATINPGRNAVAVDRISLDVDTWMLTIEADMPKDGGRERWIATGRLENLGSWTNRSYRGTYRLGDERGEFSMSLN